MASIGWIITILIIITDLGLESSNSNKVLEVELLEKFPQVGVTQVTLRRKMKMIIMIDYDDRAVYVIIIITTFTDNYFAWPYCSSRLVRLILIITILIQLSKLSLLVDRGLTEWFHSVEQHLGEQHAQI